MHATFALLCHNQEKYVAEAVSAALDQTGQPLEIVISDDCSTDDTWSAIESAVTGYTGQHTIKLVRNLTNLGVGAHTDKVIREAQGEIVILAAGDDISLPHRASRIIEAFEDPQVTCVASYAMVDGKIEATWVGGADPQTAVLAGGPLHGATLAFRKAAVAIFHPVSPQVKFGEDVLLPFRAALIGKLAILKEPLVIYRRHSGSLMGGVSAATSSKQYAANLRKALASLAAVRVQQIESAQLAYEHGQISLLRLIEISTPILHLIDKEAPMRALLFRERNALLLWLRTVWRLQLSPKEAIKALVVGLAPETWQRYATWRSRDRAG